MTKILWGQIIVVCGVVFLSVWAATQYVALRLGYQPELGAPWFFFEDIPVYPTPSFFWWWFAYEAYAPGVFIEGAIIAVSGTGVAIVVAIAMSVWRARAAKCAET